MILRDRKITAIHKIDDHTQFVHSISILEKSESVSFSKDYNQVIQNIV